MTGKLAQRVYEGLKVIPEDLLLTIDADKLDMEDTFRCVLGLTHGSFHAGVQKLNIDYCVDGKWLPYSLGFCIPFTGPEYYITYRILTRIWQYAIRKRQALAAKA